MMMCVKWSVPTPTPYKVLEVIVVVTITVYLLMVTVNFTKMRFVDISTIQQVVAHRIHLSPQYV